MASIFEECNKTSRLCEEKEEERKKRRQSQDKYTMDGCPSALELGLGSQAGQLIELNF